jgi:hypothetical protein
LAAINLAEFPAAGCSEADASILRMRYCLVASKYRGNSAGNQDGKSGFRVAAEDRMRGKRGVALVHSGTAASGSRSCLGKQRIAGAQAQPESTPRRTRLHRRCWRKAAGSLPKHSLARPETFAWRRRGAPSAMLRHGGLDANPFAEAE